MLSPNLPNKACARVLWTCTEHRVSEPSVGELLATVTDVRRPRSCRRFGLRTRKYSPIRSCHSEMRLVIAILGITNARAAAMSYSGAVPDALIEAEAAWPISARTTRRTTAPRAHQSSTNEVPPEIPWGGWASAKARSEATALKLSTAYAKPRASGGNGLLISMCVGSPDSSCDLTSWEGPGKLAHISASWVGPGAGFHVYPASFPSAFGVVYSDVEVLCAYPADGRTSSRPPDGHLSGCGPYDVHPVTTAKRRSSSPMRRNDSTLHSTASANRSSGTASSGASGSRHGSREEEEMGNSTEPLEQCHPWAADWTDPAAVWVPHSAPVPSSCKPGQFCTLGRLTSCEEQFENADPKGGNGLLLTAGAVVFAQSRPPGNAEFSRQCAQDGLGSAGYLAWGGDCAFTPKDWRRFLEATDPLRRLAEERRLLWWNEVVLTTQADSAVEAVFIADVHSQLTERQIRLLSAMYARHEKSANEVSRLAAGEALRRGVPLLIANVTRAERGGDLFRSVDPAWVADMARGSAVELETEEVRPRSE